jgi:putative inorganic carbon (hco3(-)) transporter
VLRKCIEFGLFAAILISVGSFGGTEPISWGISEALVLLVGLLLVARPPKNSSPDYSRLLWFPAVLAAWIAMQWFASRAGRIGVDTHAIEAQGLTFATMIVAFFVTLEVARGRESRRRLALFLIGVGLFEALYGLGEYLAGWQYIWNVRRRFYVGSATGTYINHNHFAGFLEMILPLSLGLALYHSQSVRRRSRSGAWRSVIGNLREPEILKSLLFLLAATILLVAVVFSLSRMGLIAMLVSFGVMSTAVWTGGRRNLRPAALILFLLAGGVATAAWIGVGPVVEHFEQLPRNEPLAHAGEGRAALWKDAAGLVRAHPWTGAGLGCFEYAFTRVQSVQLTYIVDHAHNDYLEISAEIGLPCAALVFGVIFWIVARTLQASLRARSNLTRSLALGSLGGTCALLAHSFADFNFYIPANALVFSVILALGYAMSLEVRSEGSAAVTGLRSS